MHIEIAGRVVHVRKGPILGVLAAVLGILVWDASLYEVPQGSQAVVFDRMDGSSHVQDAGWHWKKPIVDEATMYETRMRTHEAKAEAASREGQDVFSDVTVIFRVNASQINTLHLETGPLYEGRLIKPIVQHVFKEATSKFYAMDMLDRTLLAEMLKQNLTEELAPYHLEVADVTLVNFRFDPDFEAEIERNVTARQRAETEKNNLTVAQYRAQQGVLAAEGKAREVSLLANATREQQGAVYLFLKWLEVWDGVLPTTLVGGMAEQIMAMMLPPTPQQPVQGV